MSLHYKLKIIHKCSARLYLALMITFISCIKTPYLGELRITADSYDLAFNLKSDAIDAASRLTNCGYILPSKIDIVVVDLNPKGLKSPIMCAKANHEYNKIFIDNHAEVHQDGPCGSYESTIAHEMLHLAGFHHRTDAEQFDFDQRLKACNLL